MKLSMLFTRQLFHTLLMSAVLMVLSGCLDADTMKKEPIGTKEEVQISGPTMGTRYNVSYIVTSNKLSPEEVQKGIDQVLESINAQMSTYRSDSELSRFNQHHSSEPFPVSEDTADVVREALRLHEITEGALDVTIGPVVNLWGFGPEQRPKHIPTAEQLQQRKQQTGVHHLNVKDHSLVKTLPSLYVDLSSIAKGRGTDEVADYLTSLGINNYMVEVGGEIRVKGKNRYDLPWRIAVEKPIVRGREAANILMLTDIALATSGDYRNYFEDNGQRYSHIIDPKTGKPINNKVMSVTVLDDSSMTADGLSTSFMVLGEKKGLRIANQYHIPVLFIVKTESGFTEIASEAFKPYLNYPKREQN